METVTALPGKIQFISGDGEFLYSEAERFVEELKNYSTASSQYTVISIIGPQGSGKSYILNTLFNANFDVLDASQGRTKQTTKGIWMAKCAQPCMIILDVEGCDGRERGDNTLFERRSALFSLTVSDVLLLNMWFNDIGRYNGANMDLIKLIFETRGGHALGCRHVARYCRSVAADFITAEGLFLRIRKQRKQRSREAEEAEEEII